MVDQKRRPKGEGSCWEQSDGTWRGYVPTGSVPARKYFTAATAREAERTRRRLLSEIEEGRVHTRGRQTLGQYLDWWVQHQRGRVAPSTWDAYRRKLAHVDQLARRLLVEQLRPEDVDDLVDRLLRKGLGPQSVMHVRSVLRNALALRVRRRQAVFNAAALAEPLHVPPFDAQPYTAEQARRILAAVAEDRLESLYWVTITTAVRKGETLGADWAHVDLDRGVWTPWCQVEFLGGGNRWHPGAFNLTALKTDQSRRPVPLPPVTVEALRRRRRAQAEERLAAGALWHDHGLVWTNPVGWPLRPERINRHFHATCDRAGVPHRRWHDLRHTGATLLLERGVPLEVVSALLRHTTIGITSDVYGHVTPQMLGQAAQVMQETFGV